MPPHRLAFAFVTATAAGQTMALLNGLADTPPMGWNNWNAFGCDVSEHLLLSTADKVVDLGLRDVGYDTVVLDDCWQADGRDGKGKLQADPTKFPNGLNYVSDKLHGQKLKFGMYSSAGEMTCARYEGSLDHEKDDAESFASWGVDFLKYDNCFHRGRMGTPEQSFNRFRAMSDALRETGRDVVLNLCSWGEDYVHTWGASISHAWRMSGDIYDSFTRPDDLCSCNVVTDPFCVAPGTQCSVLFILNRVAPFSDRSIPGGFNDLDMLEVGQGGMTDEEYKAHFALWAALKSPLMLGNDLRVMDAAALSVVNNPAVIAVSQDPHARAVNRVRRDVGIGVGAGGGPAFRRDGLVPDEYGAQETHVWSGRLENGDQVVILLNAAGADVDMEASLAEIFVADGPGGSAPHVRTRWAVHDLWANRMPLATAQRILDAESEGARADVFREANWYNSTEVPYKEGLEKGDSRLFGEKVGEVAPGGSLESRVASHAAKVFRLRRVPEDGDGFSSRKARSDYVAKDEL